MTSRSPSSTFSTSPSEAIAREAAFASVHRNLLGSDRKVTFGRFVLQRPLGRGAHGRVYAAYDPTLEREVALKVIATPSPAAVEAGLREARALARLRHPHLVRIHDAIRDGDAIGLAMELVEGTTLRQWLAVSRSRAEVLEVMLAVGEGIAALHRKGLVHRDLKPANVIVDPEHGARIIDLGLAHDFTEHSTRRLRSGTPGYLAPEQLDGLEVGPAVDQYAWAVMFWEALTGERPSPARSARGIPSGLAAVLRRALSVDPDARHPSVEAMLDAIRRWQRRSSTMRWCGVLLGGAGVLVGTQLALASTDPCAEPDPTIAAQWDPLQASRLREHLSQLSVPTAPQLADRIVARIDAGHVGLLQTQRWVCEQRAAGERMGDEAFCVREAAAELAATVRTLSEIDAVALPDAADMVAQMGGPDHCRHRAAPRPHVADAKDLRRLAGFRGRLQGLGQACPLLGAQDCNARFEALLAEVDDPDDCAVGPMAQYERGRGLMRAGRPDDARELLEAAAWSAEACGATTVELDAKRHAAALAARRGELATAEVWLAAAEATLDRIGGGELSRAELQLTRGTVTALAGNPRQSVTQIEGAIEVLRRHPDPTARTLEVAYVNLGQSAREAGDPRRAVEAIEHGLELTRERLGSTHPDVGRTLTSLGIALHQAGRPEDARRACIEAIELFEPWASRYPVELSQALNNLALMQRAAGELDAATASFGRALEILPSTGTEGPDERVGTLHNLGVTQAMAGDLEAATRTLTEAMAEAHVRWPQPTPETDRVALSLANLHLMREAFGPAQELACSTSARLDERVGMTHSSAIRAAAICATALHEIGRDAEVIVGFVERLDAIAEAEPSVDRGALRFAVAQSLARSGKRSRALELGQAAATDVIDDPASHGEVEAWLQQLESDADR